MMLTKRFLKKLFYVALFCLALFEVLRVYFIMPMPGSQQLNFIGIAYFLHTYRWIIRALLLVLILIGAKDALMVPRVHVPILIVVPVFLVVYIFNFRMTADKIFLQPKELAFQGKSDHNLPDSTIILATEINGEAKAYPVRFISYHHQIRDTIGGKPVMVTYCNVCRTGRIYDPLVNGAPETFRLVGMDHFNAMFEDSSTKSWWLQSTGEAVIGKLKGSRIPELESMQLTVNKFFSLYPFGKIMQPEYISRSRYDSLGRFESGMSKNALTRTDTVSWKDKSWVIGVAIGEKSKAYDWKDLKRESIIHDQVGDTPVAIFLSDDTKSFAAFLRKPDQLFTLKNDTITSGENKFLFSGVSLTSGENLKRVNAYQEFWHSWRTFHPETSVYKKDDQ